MDIVLELQDGDIDAIKDYILDEDNDLDSIKDIVELLVEYNDITEDVVQKDTIDLSGNRK